MATSRHVPLLVVLASATVGVNACDETAEDGDQLAVGAVDGDVTAYFRLCDGERPISLRFFELDGDQVAGDGGDVLLTEIGDLTGSNLDAGVVVGSYDDLSPGKAYFVEMNTSRQKPWIVFETEELPTDAVISSGRLMSLGEFRDGAGAEFC